MRAILIHHDKAMGPGLLEPLLKAAGFSLTNRFRDVHYEDGSAELVVVLGGLMSLAEADEHPFLHHEVALLSERLAADRPTLGLGLGAQLLARAAGAEVIRGKNGVEVGTAPIRWTKAGLEEPVVQGVRAKTNVAHWHADTWQPVPGAVLLASSDRYTQQAFRLGRAFGFQFHPELGAAGFSRLIEEGRDWLGAQGKVPSALLAEASKLGGSDAERLGLCERLVHALKKP